MRKYRSSSHLFLLILGTLLIAVGGWVSLVELRTSSVRAQISPERIVSLAAGTDDYGFSIGSRQRFLFECRDAMVSLFARVQTSQVRNNLNQTCLSASDEIVAEQPTFSVAWLTGALAASQISDWSGFNRRLVNSQRTGSAEQWIAEIRLNLAEQYYEKLEDAAKAGTEADMVLLTDTDSGLLQLARLWVRVPTSRVRVTEVVDRAPEVSREKFLRRVRLVYEGRDGQ
jgi:hypothetical protein